MQFRCASYVLACSCDTIHGTMAQVMQIDFNAASTRFSRLSWRKSSQLPYVFLTTTEPQMDATANTSGGEPGSIDSGRTRPVCV